MTTVIDIVQALRVAVLPVFVFGALFLVARAVLAHRGLLERPLGAGEVALAALGGGCLAIVMHWPLPLLLGVQVPAEIQDPVLQAWHLVWGAHALLTQPLDPFQANAHWPFANVLVYTDGMIGFAPFGLLSQSVGAAVVEYDLLFLGSYALAFLGVYLLARELGAGRGAAVVAGVAFAYAPWRIAQSNHLNVLSSGGIPVSLFLLLRGYRHRSAAMVLGGFVAAVWQLSLGFALGLQFGYLLAVLGLLGAGWWLRAGRPAPGARVGAATGVGLVVLAVTAALLASPYLEVARTVPDATRDIGDVQELSPRPSSFVTPAGASVVWGRATEPLREGLAAAGEQALFPGVVIFALALAGLVSPRWPWVRRAAFALGLAVLAVLALGTGLADGRFGYRWLYEYGPGWEGVRTPGRLMTLVTLGLALLAGTGADAVLGRLRGSRRSEARLAMPAPATLGAVILTGLVLLEGWNPVDMHTVPPAPPGQRGAPAPQLHGPSDLTYNQLYSLWSADDGFPPILNGGGSTPDTLLDELEVDVAERFPDRRTVGALRRAGVGSVVFHPDLAEDTDWEGLELRPFAGLGLRRREGGGVVVYELRP